MSSKKICGRAGSLLVVVVDDAQGKRAVLAQDQSFGEGHYVAKTLVSVGGRAYVSSLIEALRAAEEELAK